MSGGFRLSAEPGRTGSGRPSRVSDPGHSPRWSAATAGRLDGTVTQARGSTTILATGQVNKSDELDVELHLPADLPAFILVMWPSAPSVANPDNFSELVAAVFRVLADARVTVSRMRGDRRTR